MFRIATRSQSRSASSSRWVVRKIVTPRCPSPTISSWTSRAATGSRPAVGSSRKSTSGSLSNARARAVRWRRPFESVPHGSCARSVRSIARRACVDAAAGVGHLVQVGEALEILEHAQAEVEARRLGHDRDPAADLDAVLRGEIDPGDRRRARARGDERAERPDGRGLARAVGAEEAEDLAARHVERDVVDGEPIAEALRQVPDRYGGHAASRSPAAPGRLRHSTRR